MPQCFDEKDFLIIEYKHQSLISDLEKSILKNIRPV